MIVDAERVLPEEYDDEFTRADTDTEERGALSAVYIKARGLGEYR